MADRKTKSSDTKKTLDQYVESLDISTNYCRPTWESYTRFYEYWRGVKPPELDATISNIWINLFHSFVQNRLPLIFENVFSHPEYLTLKSDSPEYDFSRAPAQAWLRNLLDEKIKIRASAYETLQSTLIGGTGFRMPYVAYKKEQGRQVPIITSRNLNFFNVLPSPNGSQINASDYDNENMVDWMFVIDWWSEDKIKKLGDLAGGNKAEIGRMLDRKDGDGPYEEDQYKDRFKQINGQSYTGYGDLYKNIANLPSNLKKRRIVHWFRRDKHIIVAEDMYVIYDGKPPIKDGIIPVVKYSTNPDMNNFYGISQLEMVEDLVMAQIMNFNYRMDHMLGVMFPTTWIRDDVRRTKSMDDFIPRPYSVNFFPSSVSDIRNAIHYDRRPEVSQQTFMEEGSIKAFLQNVSGELETTGSMQDVVGNRSATGVTTISGQLKARPNMEAAIVEETGFRPECEIILMLGDKHINRPVNVRTPATGSATAWQRISPFDITDKFTVQMHGAKWNMDKSVSFQKMLSLYPMWNGKEGVDQFQLDTQTAAVADVYPEPQKLFNPPAPQPVEPVVRPSSSPGAPGGLASQQDMGQQTRSVANRTTVQPGTGDQVKVF